MTWQVTKHVDQRRLWPPLDVEVTPCIELALRALWLIYNKGEESRDRYGDLEGINYRTDQFGLMYFHTAGHMKVYIYSEPNRIESLAIQFDLTDARRWNSKAMDRVLELMRLNMVLDDLSHV